MNPQGSTVAAEVEALKAEVERLKEQIASGKPDFEFLGETIPGGLLPDLLAGLARGRKLSVRGAKTRPIGTHGDGGNLWLQVTGGGRSWLFRYRSNGRPREMGLGALCDVPLPDARARAFICRKLVKAGVDPIERRRSLLRAVPPANKRTTFRQAAERYFESKKAGWKSAKHTIQFPSTMRDYVYPVFGDWPVGDIDTDAVMKVLEPIWTTKPETAARVRARIEQVLDWARVLGMRRGENCARWRGHLQALLPARSKVRDVEPHAALPWAQMHEFWSALSTRTSASAEALMFAILTAARTGEVIGARWREIDLKAGCWTVPKERMKAGRQHRVPLSAEAVAVLERMKPLMGGEDDFVFPGAKEGSSLSQMALTMVLRKLGRGDLTVHGFRSSFRDWAAETTTYANEMVEMALAHVISNKAEAAYRRGDMFERRRRLMQDWAVHCRTAPATAGKIVAIGAAR